MCASRCSSARRSEHRFTAGAMRVPRNTVDELYELVPEVMSIDDRPIRRLHAAGELGDGLFYFDYPGGTGLTSGAVFDRIAGAAVRAA